MGNLSEWSIVWELLQLPLMCLIAFLAKRGLDRVYQSKYRHTAWGFAAMYLSWLVYGVLAIAIYLQF